MEDASAFLKIMQALQCFSLVYCFLYLVLISTKCTKRQTGIQITGLVLRRFIFLIEPPYFGHAYVTAIKDLQAYWEKKKQYFHKNIYVFFFFNQIIIITRMNSTQNKLQLTILSSRLHKRYSIYKIITIAQSTSP